MKKAVLCFVLVGLLGSCARAELLTIYSPPQLHYYNGTQVILNLCDIDTDGAEWLSSVFYCEITSGVLFQDPTYVATEALKWTHIPGVNEVDSWLAAGVSLFADGNELATLPGMSGDPSNAAASITFIADLQSGAVPAWNDIGAQFAFTPDAQGLWAFKVSVKGSDPVLYVGTVMDGVMTMVPEPSVLLLGLAGAVLLAWRRR